MSQDQGPHIFRYGVPNFVWFTCYTQCSEHAWSDTQTSAVRVCSEKPVTFWLRVSISLRANCKQPWASCLPTVCSGQLSLLPFAGGEWVVTYIYRLRGEGLYSVYSWLGQWYDCVLHRGSNCSLARAMDGRIMRHGIISSCQSAATSEIVKRFCSRVWLM